MVRRRSVTGPATCAAAAMLVLTGAPAQADDTADIVVAPSDGLTDGQVVQVDGIGWPDPRYDAQSWGLLQCRGTTVDLGACGNPQSIPESAISADGSWSVDYPVRRSSRSYDGSTAIACDPGCNVVAFMLVSTDSRPGIIAANAPVTFANPK
jgi:hypothetical protein